MIHGNTEGIRDSVLKELETLYSMEFDEELFAPAELSGFLARYTGLIRREISVYLSRGGDVLDVSVGDNASVALPEIRLRRSLDRLSGVRCLHTHPDGNAQLSDVDLTALVRLRLDAMAAIGVCDGQAIGIQAAFLGEREDGVPQPFLTEIVPLRALPQRRWMERIEESDRAARADAGGRLCRTARTRAARGHRKQRIPVGAFRACRDGGRTGGRYDAAKAR